MSEINATNILSSTSETNKLSEKNETNTLSEINETNLLESNITLPEINKTIINETNDNKGGAVVETNETKIIDRNCSSVRSEKTESVEESRFRFVESSSRIFSINIAISNLVRCFDSFGYVNADKNRTPKHRKIITVILVIIFLYANLSIS